MRRTPAAPAMPPNNGPQSIGYDDSKWRGLDVPHDYVVEQLPDSSLEGNDGCRPKNVSWYRKNITITAVRMRVCYPPPPSPPTHLLPSLVFLSLRTQAYNSKFLSNGCGVQRVG